MPAIKLIVVYRAAVFERYAPELLGSEGTEEFVDFIAAESAGGQRHSGRRRPAQSPLVTTGDGGKRGGVRVVYYYHSDAVPLGLFAVYGKGMKDDLTGAEKSTFRQIIGGIKREFDRIQLK